MGRRLGGKWGMIDKIDKEIVQPKYDRIISLGENLFAVGTDVEVIEPQP